MMRVPLGAVQQWRRRWPWSPCRRAPLSPFLVKSRNVSAGHTAPITTPAEGWCVSNGQGTRFHCGRHCMCMRGSPGQGVAPRHASHAQFHAQSHGPAAVARLGCDRFGCRGPDAERSCGPVRCDAMRRETPGPTLSDRTLRGRPLSPRPRLRPWLTARLLAAIGLLCVSLTACRHRSSPSFPPMARRSMSSLRSFAPLLLPALLSLLAGSASAQSCSGWSSCSRCADHASCMWCALDSDYNSPGMCIPYSSSSDPCGPGFNYNSGADYHCNGQKLTGGAIGTKQHTAAAAAAAHFAFVSPSDQ